MQEEGGGVSGSLNAATGGTGALENPGACLSSAADENLPGAIAISSC